MKLTDDLKKKLEAAQTKEERDAILAEMKGGAQRAGARGKMILPSFGKEFFPSAVSTFFTRR